MERKPYGEIEILGTGDSMGVPRVYCSCSVCEEARLTGINRRYRSSVLLKGESGELLVDCGPDWLSQMERTGRKRVHNVLITHAHFDHVGGLPELADLCRWTDITCRLFAPQEVLETIRRQFPWIEAQLTMQPIDQVLQLFDWTIVPFKVCHGKNGFSYAYRFEREGYTWVYCPDSINLEAEREYMRQLDLLVLGTSFYKEEAEFSTRSVYDMVEAIELLKDIQPRKVWFTHMSHDVDLRRAYPLPEHVRAAVTGERIPLD